jgi:hypothetical protein
MVLLIPDNANPTMADINEYIFMRGSASSDIESVVREIRSKSGAGALLHPAEEYFVERVAALIVLD